MFASFAPSHTELTSVLGTQVGLHQSKVRGTAKASTRVGNDCVCSFWKSSEVPPSDHDSSVESVKTCPKTSESEVCRSSDLRGDPLDAMSVGGEGGDPIPSASGELDQYLSSNHEFVRGRFCEASGEDNLLASQIREHGVVVHKLSGM